MLAEPVLRHLTLDRLAGDLAAVFVVLVSHPPLPLLPLPHSPPSPQFNVFVI